MDQNKEIIEHYLNLSVKQQFDIDLDLKDEFTFTENLVSKKTIIAPTFSDKILSKPEIKEFLSALISDMNNEIPSQRVQTPESQQMRNII